MNAAGLSVVIIQCANQGNGMGWPDTRWTIPKAFATKARAERYVRDTKIRADRISYVTTKVL